MTGVAAIALCAAFTSCSKGGDELYDPDHGSKVIAATYEEAFRNVFGNPAPTQEWGFGDNNRTRASINVNGNQWESCPSVGTTEDADVTAYVQSLTTLPNTNPAQLQNYYVTQIHKGTQTYTDLDNHSGILGSDKMNNLHIAMQSTATLDKSTGKLSGDWEHINNFNAGNCTDWSSGDGYGNTLVTGGGTFDFAYEGAEDSKYHNRWIAIDGANVPKTGGGNYAGKYYVCFDFEATNDNVKTVFKVRQPGNNPGETFEDNVTVDGAWTVESAAAAGLTVTARGKEVTITADNAEVTQYVEGNKVVIGNDVYDDWIIRLVEAVPTDNPPIEENKETDWIRVFGEDLNANDPSDFDFNDVVIDIRITKTGAECILQAAGGTMPLRINGDNNLEVHKLFGVSTDVMVNTNAENTPDPGDPTKMMKGVSGKAAVPFTLTGKFNGTKSVKIEVNKGGWQELTAERGVPASKIGVPQNTAWPLERVSIKERYPNFTNWVTTNTNYQGVWY